MTDIELRRSAEWCHATGRDLTLDPKDVIALLDYKEGMMAALTVARIVERLSGTGVYDFSVAEADYTLAYRSHMEAQATVLRTLIGEPIRIKASSQRRT
jgi:hypothetical protein